MSSPRFVLVIPGGMTTPSSDPSFIIFHLARFLSSYQKFSEFFFLNQIDSTSPILRLEKMHKRSNGLLENKSNNLLSIYKRNYDTKDP